MQSQEKEVLIKALIILKQQNQKNKKQEEIQSKVSNQNESSFSDTYSVKNQQQLENQHNMEDQNNLNQNEQPQSNITNQDDPQFPELLNKTYKSLQQIIIILYNLNQAILRQRLDQVELIPYQLKTHKLLPLKCEALSFNYNQTILAMTNEKDIYLHYFEESDFEQNQNLFEAHNFKVTSLVFSKKTNILYSGGDDFFIHMWEELQSQQWQKKISTNTNSPISCMLLNKQETLIFVGNKYGFVQVWFRNYQKNVIQYVDEKKNNWHKKCIHGISLNSSEDRLITCSSDNKIMLWTISQQGKLTEKAVSNRQSSVYSIHFLDDKKILLTQNKIGLIELKLINDEFQKDQKIIEDQSDDHPSFPIQYNQTYNIVLIKHNRFIYIYRVLNQGGYELMNKLEYKNNKIYGTLSNDGKKLITFNDEYLQGYE